MALFYHQFENRAVVTRYVAEDGMDTVYIPNEVNGVPVTEIGPRAFRKTANLKTVIIPMTLEIIAEEAFADCEQLTCVGVAESEQHSVFPPSLKYIGERAFMRSGLRELSFASRRIELDRFCFFESAVVSAFFVGTDITLKESAFSKSSVRLVAMHNAEIDYIDDGCFAFCGALEKVVAKQVNGVGSHCFKECVLLDEFPAKRPLDHVGDGAFHNCCSLKTTGYFRTMRDLIHAWGIEYMLNETLKYKCPPSSWTSDEYSAANFKLANAAKSVADKIKNATFLATSEFTLLRVIGSEYRGPRYDVATVDRFFLYAKSDIQSQFRDVWDWNMTDERNTCVMPPRQYIEDLSAGEIYTMLQFENTPKPYVIDWDNLDRLLNADLGGDSVKFNGATVTAFLSYLLDHEVGKAPGVYKEIPAEEIALTYFEDDFSNLTEEEKLHYFTWGILYNRIAIYRELKHTYHQLMRKNNSNIGM